MQLFLRSLSFVCLFWVSTVRVQAQVETLVSIDPLTGIHTVIDTIPDVKWIVVGLQHTSTFDASTGQYIFLGLDSLYDSFIYTLDAPTAAVVSNPTFLDLYPGNNQNDMQFESSTGILYALHFGDSDPDLRTIDPATGLHTVINPLPSVYNMDISGDYTTFNENDHQYIFKGYDSGMNKRLFTLDAVTGNVLFSPLFPALANPIDKLHQLRYSNSLNTLFCLYEDNVNQLVYFGSIDQSTGLFSIMDTINGLDEILIDAHYATFDELNQHFIFVGQSFDGIKRLYSIDATNGAIASNPAFFVGLNTAENIIELHFDNTTGILYALHWDVDPANVTPPDEPYFSLPDYEVCTGDPIFFSYGGTGGIFGPGYPTTYLWDFGDGTTSTGSSTSHAYAAPGVYYVNLTATNAGGSTTTSVPTWIFVNPYPNLVVTPDTTICSGTSITLNASGASSYFWYDQTSSASSVVVTPLVDTIFHVSGTTIYGCSVVEEIHVYVNPTPNTGTANPLSLCASETSVDLQNAIAGEDAGGTWTDLNATGNLTGTILDLTGLTPGNTYSFSYDFPADACSIETITELIILNPEIAGLAVTGQNSCADVTNYNLFDLLSAYTAGGVWADDDATGALSGSDFNTTTMPAGNYNFTYSITDGCGTDSETVSLEILPLPDVSISGKYTICQGENLVIVASGAVTYLWNEALGSGATQTVSPPVTTTYIVTGTTNGCSAQDSITITVEDCLSVNENNAITFTVYPNPASDYLTLQGWNTNDELIYSIYSADGKLVQAENQFMNQPIAVSDLKQGIYYLKLTTAGQDYFIKFVKSN